MQVVRITHAGVSIEATPETWQARLDELIKSSGQPFSPATKIEMVEKTDEPTEAETMAAAKARGLSWGAEGDVVDPEAVARLARFDAAMAEAGETVRREGQVAKAGTRMADIGYQTQHGRRADFLAGETIRDVMATAVSTIEAEKRTDLRVTAGQLAGGLKMNGAVTWNGLKFKEQAIRGLLSRFDSPALRYVLGLRDRITERDEHGNYVATKVGQQLDRDALVDVLQRECKRFPEAELILRTREGLGDVFTVVSPGYTNADFPKVAPILAAELPGDARGQFIYNQATTRWQLRARVWTPTPVAEQAIGEPFEGFGTFSGGDAGLTGLSSGGGFLLLACYNAGILEQMLAAITRRVHRGDVLRDVRKMVGSMTKAIDLLIGAWGQARQTTIELPTKVVNEVEQLIPLEQAIPGFFLGMLTQRKGELVGVLPGRSKKHVDGLTAAYFDQRRDPEHVTRADLANGWTRYLQGERTDVQLDAQKAIGRWLVNPKGQPVSYVAA